LIEWYRSLVATLLERLQPSTYDACVELASLPDTIRGYEAIKLRNVAAARARAESLLALLHNEARTAPPARATTASAIV
jgi:indolepyruvate ferredoxin oxidoreductase